MVLFQVCALCVADAVATIKTVMSPPPLSLQGFTFLSEGLKGSEFLHANLNWPKEMEMQKEWGWFLSLKNKIVGRWQWNGV